MTDPAETPRRRRGLPSLPWPVRLAVLVALSSGVYLAAQLVHPSRHRSLLEAAVTGAIQGLLLFALLAVVTRWQGGPEAARLAQRAIRRRRIPDDADLALLETGLHGFRRTNRRLRWWFAGCVLALVLIAVAVTALRGDPAALLIVVPAVALGVAYPVVVRSRLRRVDALLAELGRRQAPGEGSGAAPGSEPGDD